jgi:hypothetical protein
VHIDDCTERLCRQPQYRIDLMPAPDVYDEEQINPLTDNSLLENSPYEGILYVTDRAPTVNWPGVFHPTT